MTKRTEYEAPSADCVERVYKQMLSLLEREIPDAAAWPPCCLAWAGWLQRNGWASGTLPTTC